MDRFHVVGKILKSHKIFANRGVSINTQPGEVMTHQVRKSKSALELPAPAPEAQPIQPKKTTKDTLSCVLSSNCANAKNCACIIDEIKNGVSRKSCSSFSAPSFIPPLPKLQMLISQDGKVDMELVSGACNAKSFLFWYLLCPLVTIMIVFYINEVFFQDIMLP